MKRFDMDVDTHEAVWTLGARAAREARGKLDLDGAFIAAVRKYGTKVFPAAKGHEDDPWFEEYFQAFRDGAEAAGVNESTMAMRGLIRRLEESSVKDSGSSEWVAQNLAMLAANFAQQATETYRGRGTAYPRKWYGKMEKVLAGNGFGPLNAKQLALFSEAYERFMAAYGSEDGQDLDAIERITKDITNRALALVRAS